MQAAKTLWQSFLWRSLYYISAFVINILIARHFEASLSGSVYYLSSIYAFAVLLSSLSIESGIIYFSAKAQIPVERLFSFSILWTFITGLVTLLIVFLLFKNAYHGISSTLLIVSAVLYISGNLLTTYCAGFFYAHSDFRSPNIIVVICTILLVAIIPYNGQSVIPAVTNKNYFYVYFGSFFVQGICMAIAAKLKYIKAGLFHFITIAEFRMLFRYCVLTFTGNVIFFLLYRVDYFFVEKYCTAHQLGNYIQVSKLVHLFFLLPTIMASAVFTISAGEKLDSINKLLPLLSRSIFLLYTFTCFILGLVGQWLFPFIFGATFTSMYHPFLMLIPGILALSGMFTITAYFAGKNKVKINIIAAVYAFIVILAGDIIFIPRYGIVAAALVSSLGYIVYQVYIIRAFKKEYECSVADFFIFRQSDWKQIQNAINASLKIKNGS
jgi:O-antigen/teichoic acid export membrane protein